MNGQKLTTLIVCALILAACDQKAQQPPTPYDDLVQREGIWASRDMKELFKVTSGVVTTYQTADGSGYIKMIDLSRLNQEMRKSLGSYSETQYIEHFSLGLTTFTYQGSLLQ